MDIVLDTVFNNPNLPVVQIPGFTDSFNRPAASTLGVTDDGKEWLSSGTSWSITAEGRATKGSGGARAWVDGLSSNGTLTAVLAKASAEDQRNGLLFRQQDGNNYLYLCPNTSGVLTLYARIDNLTALSKTITGVTVGSGDTLSVIMLGPQVTVLKNGTQIHVETVSDLVSNTNHGLYGTGLGAEWDSIEFVPA